MAAAKDDGCRPTWPGRSVLEPKWLWMFPVVCVCVLCETRSRVRRQHRSPRFDDDVVDASVDDDDDVSTNGENIGKPKCSPLIQVGNLSTMTSKAATQAVISTCASVIADSSLRALASLGKTAALSPLYAEVLQRKQEHVLHQAEPLLCVARSGECAQPQTTGGAEEGCRW